jgi:ATP-binding cassette subfamily B (MDR/TAP) protein 1
MTVDTTAADLQHAAKDIEEQGEEKQLAAAAGSVPNRVVPEKEKGLDSSSSSDDGDRKIEKVDSRVIDIPLAKKAEDEYAHLPEHEADILRKQVETPDVKINYFSLYRYATRNDLIIIAISALCSIAGGAAMPLMTVIFGQLTQTFTGFFQGQTSQAQFNSDLSGFTLYFVYLAIGEFITIYIATVGTIYTGEHIAQKIREQYLAAILRQNVGFFDKLGGGEITTRITADTNLIQEAISEKTALTLTALSTFFSAFVIGFIKSWKLTLILSSTIVAIVLSMGIGSSFIVRYSKASLQSYAEGGSVAEEVLSSIRNAVAFGTQEKLAAQYRTPLERAQTYGTKLKMILGCMIAFMMMVIQWNYGLAFWQGGRFLVRGDIDVGATLTISMAIIIGAFSLGNVAPNAQAFTTGTAAAAKIYNTIDRKSPLDPTSDEGKKLESVEGSVELRGVKHIYPSRSDVVVMRDCNLVVPAGKTVALVGASGSGKSTIVGLVERFYDPVAGQVFLDGHDIKDLNIRWLRQQISLVSQEPVLFATTIKGNIRHGLIGTKYEQLDEEKQMELIVKAAEMANAHQFITGLSEGYDTHVGERGFLLSGGQKQRIAIARAMVSDPKILLLDEATSALDSRSEGVVQAALDRAAQGRTTIVVAHRLSTIRDADVIVVMSKGRIVEQGTHGELLDSNGAYAGLVEAQKLNAKRAEEAAEDPRALEVEAELMKTATRESKMSEKHAPELNRTQTSQSISSVALKKDAAKDQQYSLWTLIKMVASFNSDEKLYMFAGLFWSIIAGGGNPTQAVFMAKAITALSYPPILYNRLTSEISFWSLMYLMLGFVMLLAFAAQGIAFALCSERLILRARDKAFRHLLRQDISFFDRDENAAGALTSFLSTETTHLAGLSGSTLGTILVVTTTLIAAIVVSVAIAWKLALVCTSTIPILLACGFFRFWLLARFQARAKAAYEKSASYACEATSAIRTVASLTREADVWENYHQGLEAQGKKSLNSVAKTSTLYAFSQAGMFLCTALGFWYGGTRIAAGELSMFQFFVAFTAVIFGAQSAGTIFSFAPDMGKAKTAAQEMKVLFDRKPQIDTWSTDGTPVDTIEGDIEFRDVHFRYPTRPEQPVLRGLNLTVKPGQYVALVGASGCGKSTTIQLLERFYDPLTGGVFIDGKDISSLNVNQYRSFVSLVSQEPTLYQGTIRENIVLGLHEENVADETIIRACEAANIYEFIMSLPETFNTVVGSKGSMLSGGQKQRIAIARALIRNPKVLLLDEATSALDSESEKVVQAALDRAAEGRTTIAVAHRLSTIQKADRIYVFDAGRIVEAGTHQELLGLRGKYSELVNLQSLEKAH